MKAFVKNFNFRSVILRRALVEMAAKAGQGARLKPEVDGKMLLVRKRTRKDLDHYSESTGGDSLTDCETCSSGSSSSSSSSFRTDDTYDYDDSSRGIYSKSEYYYSSENTRWANDIDSDYDESSWRASTGKGFFWDARRSQTGAGQGHPVYNFKKLGEGSFAVVHLCYSKANKVHFAVKCAKPSRRGALKSLTKEADLLKQLNSPYIIEYLGECRVQVTLKATTGATRAKLVPMVTEIYLPYIKGGTLSDEIKGCLKNKKTIKESVIQSYTKQIVSGLAYLHSKNIVHCDIKGSNILMGKPNLKISDFGLSKRIEKNLSEQRSSVSRAGTKAWMAPEVQRRIWQGFPGDVWSLGCTVVQMITGKPPVTPELKSFLSPETLPERIMHSPVIPKVFKRLSLECIDFLEKCFIKDPKVRWTCEQLLDHPFLKPN